MTSISERTMKRVARSFCLPMMLIISYALFQYLLAVYFHRRRQWRGALLLVCAFVGFATLIPYSHPHEDTVRHLNDISEACSTLTFLLQITMLGRDSSRKVRMCWLVWLTTLGEVLVMVDLATVIMNAVAIICPNSVNISNLEAINAVTENVILAFIIVFRFTYMALIWGVKKLFKSKKLEMALYVMFLTHEYPFMALESSTGVSWEYVQGLYHRSIVLCCILITLQEKIKRGAFANASGLSIISQTTDASHHDALIEDDTAAKSIRPRLLRGVTKMM